MNFLRDVHWYFALLLAVVCWILYGIFISPLKFNSLFDSINLLIFSVLLYPIVEEIVFRGLIQEYFSRRTIFNHMFIGLSLANISTSVLFALSHLWSQSPLWALLTFFPSLVYGYFKERHNHLLPGIALHSLYNLGFIMLIMQI